MIDFDVETTGLQPYSGVDEAFLWIFGDDDGKAEAILFWPSKPVEEQVEAHAKIQAWLYRGAGEGIRAWNAKFDRGFADMANVFDVPGDECWHDGMLVAHVVDERRSVALKAVAAQLFGEDAADPQKQLKEWLNKENRRRQAEARVAKEDKHAEYVRANYSHVPMEIMEPYALEDVILTRKISDHYQHTVLDQEPDLQGVYDFERKAMDAIYAMEKRGLPVRDGGVEYRKLEQECIDNLTVLEERVMSLAAEGDPRVFVKALGKGEVEVIDNGSGQETFSYTGGAVGLDEFKPNSSAHVLAALKARGADMSYMSQKDGKLSADADNLRAVDDELAAAILEFRSEYKVLSTYVRPMVNRSYVSAMNMYKQPFVAKDSRIHATYRQVGARTGRMSCADPNMQNQPRDDLRLRYNIVADPGYSLVACDLSNIEMVLFAAYCGEGRLLDAVKAGEDLHVLTAKMLGLRDRRRPGGGIETARQLGKVYNFSRIYGGGLRTIRRSFRCSLDEARLLKRRFDDAYPEVGRLQTRVSIGIQDYGYVQDKLISGRRFRVAQQDDYKAVNYLVQGTAASLLKYAVIQLHKDGVPMVALIHDEIVAHVPTGEATEAAKLIEKRMTEFEGLQGVVPLRAEADIIQRWSDAKPLKDDDGKAYYFDPEWANVNKRRYVA